MANNKSRFGVLLLHIFIHLIVSSIIVVLVSPGLLPYVFLLAIIHLLIDIAKHYVNVNRPQWIVAPYLIDQLFHIISILFISILISRYTEILPFALRPPWLIGLTALLFVTYVWYISEKIISFHNSIYFQQVIEKEWSRMFSRAFLLAVFLISIQNLSIAGLFGLGAVQFPYRSSSFGIRALVTDLIVSFSGAFYIYLIL